MTRLVHAIACALTLANAGISVVAQQQTPPTTISTLLQDAQTLAANAVPFGLALGKDDSLSMQVWRPVRPPSGAVTRQGLVADFRADWRERFNVSEANGVLSAVSTRGSVCTSALDRQVKAQTITGSPGEVLFAMML